MPDVVRLGHYEDATSALSHWHVPAAHYLETWSDGLTPGGSYVAMQPMILPLFDGLSELDVLSLVAGQPIVDGPQLVQETFRATSPPGDFETAWSKFLHDGFASHLPPKNRPPKFNGNTAGGVAHTLWTNEVAPPTKDSPEIVLVGSYAMDDGRYINNGWLQEMPDPVTKLTWDNAAMMSPAFAHQIGVKDGDLVQVTVTEPTPKAAGDQRQAVGSDSATEEADPAPIRHCRAHCPGTCGKLGHHPVGLRPQAYRPGRRRSRLQFLSAPHDFQSALHRRR